MLVLHLTRRRTVHLLLLVGRVVSLGRRCSIIPLRRRRAVSALGWGRRVVGGRRSISSWRRLLGIARGRSVLFTININGLVWLQGVARGCPQIFATLRLGIKRCSAGGGKSAPKTLVTGGMRRAAGTESGGSRVCDNARSLLWLRRSGSRESSARRRTESSAG